MHVSLVYYLLILFQSMYRILYGLKVGCDNFTSITGIFEIKIDGGLGWLCPFVIEPLKDFFPQNITPTY